MFRIYFRWPKESIYAYRRNLETSLFNATVLYNMRACNKQICRIIRNLSVLAQVFLYACNITTYNKAFW